MQTSVPLLSIKPFLENPLVQVEFKNGLVLAGPWAMELVLCPGQTWATNACQVPTGAGTGGWWRECSGGAR